MDRSLSRQWRSGCRRPKTNSHRAGVDWTPVWFSIEHKLNSHDPIGGGFSQFGSLLLRDKGRLLPNICVLQSDTTYSFSVDQSWHALSALYPAAGNFQRRNQNARSTHPGEG